MSGILFDTKVLLDIDGLQRGNDFRQSFLEIQSTASSQLRLPCERSITIGG